MAVTKQQVILEFNADTGGINKDQQTEKSVDDVTAAPVQNGPCRSARQNDRGRHQGFRKYLDLLKTAVSKARSRWR